MNYQLRIKWTQPYVGWQGWQLQQLEQQLTHSNFAEAKTVLAKVMSL